MADTVKLSKDVPVTADVDVVVAGAGIAGSMAAVAAAREGARTLLVERFGCPGGNMVPGMFSGGVAHLALGHPWAQLERLKGLPGEFIDRCEGYAGHVLGRDYFKDSQVAAYVWLKMMEENGVQLLCNTFAADPIMDGNAVKGLVVENMSGSQAIRAKVTIDGTGNADIAWRAGAPLFQGEKYVHPGMYFALANVNVEKYLAWRDEVKISEEDDKWGREVEAKLGGWGAGSLRPFWGLMRRAWQIGEYRFIKPIGDIGVVTLDHGFWPPNRDIVGAQVGIADSRLSAHTKRQIDCGDIRVMNELEIGCRVYIFETAQFMRRYAPGFEDSHLHMVASYFHGRGSRGIVCERQLTLEEAMGNARFDDVIFLTYENNAPAGDYDFPYRQLLPRGVRGLLATGKSAIVIPPNNRARWKMLVMGQATGVAASLAARDGVTPGAINLRELQRILHGKYHMPLGAPERMKELGIEN